MVRSSLEAQLLRVMFPLQQCLLLNKKKKYLGEAYFLHFHFDKIGNEEKTVLGSFFHPFQCTVFQWQGTGWRKGGRKCLEEKRKTTYGM